MNIPCDELYTLLNTALKNRGQETLQRTLYLSLREYILSGRLQSGSRLSGSRTLAGHLSLSRNTVNGALEQLTLEGYLLRSRRERGWHRWRPVSSRRIYRHLRLRLPGGLAHCLPLYRVARRFWPLRRGHRPSTIFLAALAAPVRSRVAGEGSALLGYGDPAGEPALRAAIARHLALSAGLTATPARL